MSSKSTKQQQKYWSNVHSNRLKGIYHTKDTYDEAEVCAKQLMPDDVAFTLIHRLGKFNMYNIKEFLPQIKAWKDQKCVLLDCNVFERKIGGKDYYVFIVQSDDLDKSPSCCPLAIAMNILVSGYTYITPHKSTVELVKRILQ